MATRLIIAAALDAEQWQQIHTAEGQGRESHQHIQRERAQAPREGHGDIARQEVPSIQEETIILLP